MGDVAAIVEWLVNGAPGARTSPDVLRRVCVDLCAGGHPVERAEAFVRTLHPHIVGRSFVWWKGRDDVDVRENSWAYLQSREFAESPIGEVVSTGRWVRRRLTAADRRAPGLGPLVEQHFTDYVAAPFQFMSGDVHAITFATGEPAGFTEENLEALKTVVPPMTRVAEILALSRTAANLLSTYVGRNAGERILAGKIQRGDVDSIRAVIWFSDLRGFTSLASRVEPADLIRVLNDLFECQVPAIEEHGGEVLKFIGDGLLGIFPLAAGDANAADRCAAALRAADQAFANLERLNASRATDLRFGLALHLGEVAYGNIGGADRLDFTCIGPAVNIASRLEGVASKLGERLVLSDEVARHADRSTRDLGTFELKGVPEPRRAWAPARSEET